MEDAVRPRIASPGWWVRRRLVRAAAAPSAMRARAAAAPRQCVRARLAAAPSGRRQAGQKPPDSGALLLYLTSLAFVANLF